MISLRDLSSLTLAGGMAVLAAGLLAFAGILAFRFLRRGAARFWSAPGALALCLLPLAVGAAFAGLLLRQTMAGMALTGSGGVAAIAAGSAEALIPIQMGLGVAMALAACAFLTTAAGSSRSSAPASSGLPGWVLLAMSLSSLVFMGALLWLILSTVALLSSADPSALPARMGLALAGGFALIAVTFASGLAAPFLAPRGPSGIGMKLASLASLALCGVLCLAGLWATWTRSQSLMATAITGAPEGELPEPVAVADLPEVPPPTLPPPPPAADRPQPSEPPDRPRSEPTRRTRRESKEPASPRPAERGPRRRVDPRAEEDQPREPDLSRGCEAGPSPGRGHPRSHHQPARRRDFGEGAARDPAARPVRHRRREAVGLYADAAERRAGARHHDGHGELQAAVSLAASAIDFGRVMDFARPRG